MAIFSAGLVGVVEFLVPWKKKSVLSGHHSVVFNAIKKKKKKREWKRKRKEEKD